MQVVSTKADLKKALAAASAGKYGASSAHGEKLDKRALVMTMGALHSGHLALVKEAQKLAAQVVLSIYVNPLQFGPGEDYEKYPRQLEADLQLLSEQEVDVVFAPTDEEVYPREPQVRIDPGPAAKLFEGKTRPGHFAGVLQVVQKVLQLTQPDYAFFGEKDAQQLALVKAMVEDLNMPVEIKAVPIARAGDGVALSSRNSYLSPAARTEATLLYRALQAGASLAQQGEKAPAIAQAAAAVLQNSSLIKIDYVEVVEDSTFLPAAANFQGAARIILAAWVEDTRLIDNLAIEIK